MIVTDTNVVSELMKVEPSPEVRAWVFAVGHHELRITAITVAEILYGIELLPSGKRKAALRKAPVEVFNRFIEDVLPFHVATATVYPEIVDHRDRQGMPISGYDARVAAICRTHDARRATRNEKDFAGVGVELINPWSAG